MEKRQPILSTVLRAVVMAMGVAVIVMSILAAVGLTYRTLVKSANRTSASRMATSTPVDFASSVLLSTLLAASYNAAAYRIPFSSNFAISPPGS